MLLPCSICGRKTEWRCSDCMIDTRKTVAICTNPKCRDEHESLCNHKTIQLG